MVGTPYFMSPEVCRGDKYDAKADVWAMGVILYELITLKKPFDGRSITEVFDQIKNKPLDPLPAGTSQDLQLVIKAILNKEKDRRPTIFDLAKIPCISKKIIEFIQKYDCKDEVMSFFDVDQLTKHPQQPQESAKNKSGGASQNEIHTSMIMDQLEDFADQIRQDIQIKDYPNGWFAKHLRCAQGKDIYDWLFQHLNKDKKKAANVC